jgi:hypothetical protein
MKLKKNCYFKKTLNKGEQFSGWSNPEKSPIQ